jgi:hypothetical protein
MSGARGRCFYKWDRLGGKPCFKKEAEARGAVMVDVSWVEFFFCFVSVCCKKWELRKRGKKWREMVRMMA